MYKVSRLSYIKSGGFPYGVYILLKFWSGRPKGCLPFTSTCKVKSMDKDLVTKNIFTV